MHDETLNDAQRGLLPLMAQFRRDYLIDNPPTDEEIKATLTSISLDGV